MDSQQKKKEKLRIFAANLARRLAHQAIQSNELAEKLGIEASAVSNWTRGVNCAKGRNLRKLALVLDVTPAWFFTDHEAESEEVRYPSARPSAQRVNDSASEPIRNKCHAHLDRVLDACMGNTDQESWTYVQLTKTFPVRRSETSEQERELVKVPAVDPKKVIEEIREEARASRVRPGK